MVFQLALFGGLLFGPAGTLDWPDAIILMIVYTILSLVSVVYLQIYHPKGLAARMQGLDGRRVVGRILEQVPVPGARTSGSPVG